MLWEELDPRPQEGSNGKSGSSNSKSGSSNSKSGSSNGKSGSSNGKSGNGNNDKSVCPRPTTDLEKKPRLTRFASWRTVTIGTVLWVMVALWWESHVSSVFFGLDLVALVDDAQDEEHCRAYCLMATPSIREKFPSKEQAKEEDYKKNHSESDAKDKAIKEKEDNDEEREEAEKGGSGNEDSQEETKDGQGGAYIGNIEQDDAGDDPAKVQRKSRLDFVSQLPNRHWRWYKDEEVIHVPRQYEVATVKMDNVAEGGKACGWDRGSGWVCQDCDESNDEDDEWCRDLGHVQSDVFVRMELIEVDDPPQQSSSFHPLYFQSESTLPIYTDALGTEAYQGAPCTTLTCLLRRQQGEDYSDDNKTSPCFNVQQQEEELTVFLAEHDPPLNDENAFLMKFWQQHLYLMQSQSPSPLIRLVTNRAEACLVLLTAASFSTDLWPDYVHQFQGLDHGHTMIWESSRMLESNPDVSRPQLVNFEMAALASFSHSSNAHIRPFFDLALAYSPQWKPAPEEQLLPVQDRSHLLTFKGLIHDWGQVFHHYRWIAGKYWGELEYENVAKHRIKVDVEIAKDGHEKPFDTPKEWYADWLLNATFSFCPGGASPGSYRFAETLLAGAIPVVLSSFVAPLEPELDWSDCLVRVSDARVIDLPAQVAQFTREQIQRRGKACRVLGQVLFWTKSLRQVSGGQLEKGSLTLALLFWHKRLRHAHFTRRRRKALRQALMAETARQRQQQGRGKRKP